MTAVRLLLQQAFTLCSFDVPFENFFSRTTLRDNSPLMETLTIIGDEHSQDQGRKYFELFIEPVDENRWYVHLLANATGQGESDIQIFEIERYGTRELILRFLCRVLNWVENFYQILSSDLPESF